MNKIKDMLENVICDLSEYNIGIAKQRLRQIMRYMNEQEATGNPEKQDQK